ncbi:hypothetical protein LTR91_010533 [Friedmanniomyces endolithicus]|uniref:Uncharacterized protein n=1 Tax=Friedmanniomyces endolithicus TaxID=329885 RepID=A0AAN6QSQ0_9PEZI|nr:hypothetical protein LTR91_010533 [Friedmanniomyces endolithicus]
MDKLKGVAKGGWHPTRDTLPIHRDSWKTDLKGIATGKKKDPYEEARSHQSTPLTTLRDPDSFGAPPKHTGYGYLCRHLREGSNRLRAHNANINGANNASLGTPYTPSRYYANGNGPVKDVLLSSDGGLRVVREPEKRDTTFSAMMERAGFRKSELDLGTQSRRPEYAVHNPRTR